MRNVGKLLGFLKNMSDICITLVIKSLSVDVFYTKILIYKKNYNIESKEVFDGRIYSPENNRNP